jgi:tetratricopeptide (TPR) repeat protein
VVPEVIAVREQAMAWFEAEHRVLLAAIAQAASTGSDTHAWQLPEALTNFQVWRGYWHDNAAAQQTALAAARRLGDLAAQARTHRGLAQVSVLLGSYQDAHAHFGQALELYRQLGDRAGEGRAHVGLSDVCDRLSRYDEALAHNMQALDLHRSVGDRAWEAVGLNNVGWCHAQLGDYQQALALAREQGDRYVQVEVLIHLGDSHDASGQPPAARQAWQQALDILDDLDHPRADEVRARLHPGASARRGGDVPPAL